MTKVGVFLAKIVAIVNQKGGVGKTTTCVNLTSSLKEKGNRILLCDCLLYTSPSPRDCS